MKLKLRPFSRDSSLTSGSFPVADSVSAIADHLPVLRTSVRMFSRFQAPVSAIARQFSTTQAAQRSVAVMGASGGEAERLMT